MDQDQTYVKFVRGQPLRQFGGGGVPTSDKLKWKCGHPWKTGVANDLGKLIANSQNVLVRPHPWSSFPIRNISDCRYKSDQRSLFRRHRHISSYSRGITQRQKAKADMSHAGSHTRKPGPSKAPKEHERCPEAESARSDIVDDG